ncbi:MAG: cupin domain-containing protein [Pseudomonadota bacterium]
MPKIMMDGWSAREGGPHPVTGQNDGPYAEIVLGKALGLLQFGVRLERIPPGSRSSHRHWHEAEDEFVFLVSGELVLVEDAETTLRAGDAAGWRAGQPTAHCLENRSDRDAVMLVVGTRSEEDVVHYPDHGFVCRRHRSGKVFTRTDGSPVNSDP